MMMQATVRVLLGASRAAAAADLSPGHWALNADWNYLPARLGMADKSNLNVFSVGAAYHF